jgi:hypothetical protein
MTARDYSLKQLQICAESKRINLIGSRNDRGQKLYTPFINENLFQPLSPSVINNFNSGDDNDYKYEIRRITHIANKRGTKISSPEK